MFSEIVMLTCFFMFFIGQSFLIEGYSMEPTLQSGERILVEKISLYLSELKYGDIVIFQNPRNSSQIYIKRVIAIEGDEVLINSGKIYINGKTLNEGYVKEALLFPQYEKIVVPIGHCYVLGDNRNHSLDSRIIGTIPKRNIIGKVLLRYWPLKKVVIFRSNRRMGEA